MCLHVVVGLKITMLSSGMLLVGLTGGLATGKSTVARIFQDLGAIVLDADRLARQAVAPRKPAYRDIVKTFGRRVLRADGTLNRSILAEIVFRNPAKLRQLNAIVHPRVARYQAQLSRQIARNDPTALIIYDAPVLIEAGAHKRMDKIIVVTADQKTQIARLHARNGFSRAEALRRIRSQIPLRTKIRLADYRLDGTLPLQRLRREVAKIKKELEGLAESFDRSVG